MRRVRLVIGAWALVIDWSLALAHWPFPPPYRAAHSNAFTSTRATAVRLASGGSGATRWDDLVVGTTWNALQSNGTDSEPDGLRDSWEIAYAGNTTTLIGIGIATQTETKVSRNDLMCSRSGEMYTRRCAPDRSVL